MWLHFHLTFYVALTFFPHRIACFFVIVPSLNLFYIVGLFFCHICLLYGVLAPPKDFHFYCSYTSAFSSCLLDFIIPNKATFWPFTTLIAFCLFAFKTEKMKNLREWLEGIRVGSGEGRSICFREKRKTWRWETDHGVRQEPKRGGPPLWSQHGVSVRTCRRIAGHWAVHLLGVHFNNGLQTYLTLTYNKKYIFYSSQETRT